MSALWSPQEGILLSSWLLLNKPHKNPQKKRTIPAQVESRNPKNQTNQSRFVIHHQSFFQTKTKPLKKVTNVTKNPAGAPCWKVSNISSTICLLAMTFLRKTARSSGEREGSSLLTSHKTGWINPKRLEVVFKKAVLWQKLDLVGIFAVFSVLFLLTMSV